MAEQFDVVVIGGGPGGYVCAIRAAQLGMNVAVIDNREQLGGTCLNVGCIPSKALLTASHKFEEAGEKFELMGIESSKPKLNLNRMMAFKDTVIKDNAKGIAQLFKTHGVTWIRGEAEFKSMKTFSVKPLPKGHRYDVTGKHIVLATGSEPKKLPTVIVDKKIVITSTGALNLKTVPEKMVIIGGGVIGIEMGVVWQRFGTKVTVIECEDTILPEMDNEISITMQKILQKQGIEFHLGTKVTSVKTGKKGAKVNVEPSRGGKTEKLSTDIVLMSIGRNPNTNSIKIDVPNIKIDDVGYIEVDEHFNTSVKGIYAIGDVISGPMLAHKAEKEGVILAERLAGKSGRINYNLIPAVVYTSPEAASVGKTEAELQLEGIKYKVGKFSFATNNMARSASETQGFLKILSDTKTDIVLGCHIIGAEASAMIHEVAMAMEFGAASEDIARTCHVHPVLNDVIHS